MEKNDKTTCQHLQNDIGIQIHYHIIGQILLKHMHMQCYLVLSKCVQRHTDGQLILSNQQYF